MKKNNDVFEITKGVSSSDKRNKSKKFEIGADRDYNNSIKIKRKYVIENQKKSFSISESRVIGWSTKKAHYKKLDVIRTIKHSIANHSFQTNPFKIKIEEKNYCYPIYSVKQKLNIMLVLDISNSIQWIVPYVEKILSVLINQAIKSKDKIGLITFHNENAQVIHYPINNIHQVIGSINNLTIAGKSPLSEGIKKANNVLSGTRYQTYGNRNLVILISDCFPEPLSGKYENPIDDPICQDFLSSCTKLHDKNIQLIIIYPYLQSKTNLENTLGFKLGSLSVEKTNGKIIPIKGTVKLDEYYSKGTSLYKWSYSLDAKSL